LVERARSGKPADAARAEVALSRTFAAYVQAMRGAVHDKMIYESVILQPRAPGAPEVLMAAATADSLEDYVAGMRWMHPLYAPLRAALTDARYSESQRQQIWTNLKRVRAIPASTKGRQVLVDAAGARLWMYENGQPVDSMKVVVGKDEMPTPMMAGFIRTAIVNPYWQVPDDLVQTNIAPAVLSKGIKYLKSEGYQVLADWDDDSPLLDPRTVDWQAVSKGLAKVHVRQLPGRTNFMGKVKFEFPNAYGIYLHDTPAKDLMAKDARQYSSGCVRLEDAIRLGQWLMGGPLPTSKTPEKSVPLPTPVPVYITYLTALPDGDGQIAFQPDPYKRDEVQLAAFGGPLDRQ
jgi:murein L,D-transpeptidase YcbB/YkuD